MLTLSFCFVAINLVNHRVHAAPSPPQPPPTVGWVSEPNGRGTFGLVTSCLFTLSICVWSAMHLNVPPKTRSTFWRWIVNFKWTGLGIFGPELIVWIAWRQYSSARVLVQHSKKFRDCEANGRLNGSRREATNGRLGVDEEIKMKELQEDKSFEPPQLKRSWNLVQGFYASMGGFVFDASSSAIQDIIPYDEKRPYLTLTAKGLLLLGECGLLPDVDEEDTKDKSKSDGLTKIIAVGQAAWMIVQIVGRIVSKQPVTLLEINTMSHVLIAFAIYILWWHKPQWVSEPTRLDGEWVKPLAAYMYMSSHISGWRPAKRHLLRGNLNEPEFEALQYHPPDIPDTSTSPSDPSYLGIVSARTLPISTDLDKHSSSLSYRPRLMPSSTLNSTAPKLGILCRRVSDLERFPSAHRGSVDTVDPLSATDPKRMARWKAATQALVQYPNLLEDHFHRVENTSNTYHAELTEYFCVATSNWPTPGLLQHLNGLLMGTASWLSSVAFGAVNLTAWNAYFPSTVERWMWRCSALWIIGSGTVWVIINASARLSTKIDAYWETVLNLRARRWDYAWITVMCAIAGTLYLGSRLFLVVEAFLSLRALEPGAYLTPDWSSLLPHLS